MSHYIPEQFKSVLVSRKTRKTEDFGIVYDGYNEPVIYDTRLRVPGGRTPFLEQLEDFDCVYVALHPFVKIEGLDPRKVNYQKLILNRSEIEGELTIEKINELQEKESAKYEVDPETHARMEKTKGRKIGWSQIASSCGFPDIRNVDRVLLAKTGGLMPEYTDHEQVNQLEQYCAAEKIFLPAMGEFPAILNRDFAEVLDRLDIQNAYLSDEFNTKEELFTVAELREETEPWRFVFPRDLDFNATSLFAEDVSVWFLVNWESHYTLVCGSNKLRESGIEKVLDGFWSDAKTSFCWWLPDGVVLPPLDLNVFGKLLDKNTENYERVHGKLKDLTASTKEQNDSN